MRRHTSHHGKTGISCFWLPSVEVTASPSAECSAEGFSFLALRELTPVWARSQMNRRKQAYARHWHLAHKPFLSRLLEALGKPKPSQRPS
jgi:hypothetical protein